MNSLIHYTYPSKPAIHKLCDSLLTPTRVALGVSKVSYGKVEKKELPRSLLEKIARVCIRALAFLGAILTFPIQLGAFGFKKIIAPQFPKKKRKVRKALAKRIVKQKKQAKPLPPIKKLKTLEKANEKLADHLSNQAQKVSKAIKKLPPASQAPGGTWRKNNCKGEQQQKFSLFLDWYGGIARTEELKIIPFMGMSKTDKKILKITSEFLAVFHNVKVEVLPGNAMTRKEIGQLLDKHASYHAEKSLKGNQINASKWLDSLSSFANEKFGIERKPSLKLMALTNFDLADFRYNFLFGLGAYFGNGIFSGNRFGNPEKSDQAFNRYLRRMLAITTHEFGHQQGISHCVDYKCNMGGYNNLAELDARPLYFCPEDMAKVCYRTKVDMQVYASNLKNYYTTFNERYGTEIDLSKEIAYLNKIIK